jgi:tetratricopeptide (TPR) repeat protein
MNRAILLLILFFTGNALVAQNFKKIDSLKKNQLRPELHDTLKVLSLNGLVKEYWSFDPDSALHFCNLALRYSEKIQFRRMISGSLIYKGYTYGLLSKFDSSIAVYTRAHRYSTGNGFKKNAGNALMGLGNIYSTLADYNKSATYYTEALKIHEGMNDSLNMPAALNGLAVIFEAQGDHQKAKSYQMKAVTIRNRKGIQNTHQGVSYNNLGILYLNQKDYDSAYFFFNQALSIFNAYNDLTNKAMTYANLGNFYSATGKRSQAINFAKNAYLIYRDLNNSNMAAAQLMNLGIEYAKYGQYNEAIKNMRECERIAGSLNSPTLLQSCYHSLVNTYSLTGDYKTALEYNQKYYKLRDSLFNIEKVKEINKLNTLYETEKKEKENRLLQKENELSAETIKQQRTTVYLVIGCLALAVVFMIFIFRAYRQKQKANEIISAQKEEVEKQKSLVEHQKNVVEEQKKDILDSIRYAKRIQDSLLPSEKFIQRLFKSLKQN